MIILIICGAALVIGIAIGILIARIKRTKPVESKAEDSKVKESKAEERKEE